MIQKELSYFIDEEMLQKVLAFAQVFNLKITRWEKSKTALKINFFNGNLPVGEFNLNTTKCPEDINGFNTYTFNFFTSFGQIKGTYIIAYDCFDYYFERLNYNSTNYNKTFGFVAYLNKNTKTISMTRQKERQFIKVLLNSNNIEIEKRNADGIRDTFYLNASLDNSKPISINFKYLKGGYEHIFSEAKMFLEEDQENKVFVVNYKFLKNKYTFNINYTGTTNEEKLTSIDFNKINEEIKNNCPDFITFISNIKDELSFAYYNNQKINFYNNIVNMFFPNINNPFFIFSEGDYEASPYKLIKKK